MNERIKELADQAHDYAKKYIADCERYNYYMEHNEYEIRYNEKFAELIVRECLLCCERVISDPVRESVDTWLNGGLQCMEEIKYNFGIE